MFRSVFLGLSVLSLTVLGKEVAKKAFTRQVNPQYHGEIFETASVDSNGMKVIPPGESFGQSGSKNILLNIFGIPEEYQTTEFHPENSLAVNGTGYLYSWYEYAQIDFTDESTGTDNNPDIADASNDYYYYYYYYNYYYGGDDTCMNTIQPNYASGIKMNTCLVAATFDNSSVTLDYSFVYSCDGTNGYKTVYGGNNCNPSSQMYTDSFALKKCHSTFGITYFSDCSPYSNVLPLPPATTSMTATAHEEMEESVIAASSSASPAWMTTQDYAQAACTGTIVEYSSGLNGTCIPIDFYFTQYSVLFSYPNITYFTETLNCSYMDANATTSTRENTHCAATQVDDDYSIYYGTPALNSSVTLITYAEPFLAVSSSPTSAPTVGPIQDASISYVVTQQLQGISAATYQSSYNTNNQVIAASASSNMVGVDVSNIEIQQVTDSVGAASSTLAIVHANLQLQANTGTKTTTITVSSVTSHSRVGKNAHRAGAEKKETKKNPNHKKRNTQAATSAAATASIDTAASSDVCYVLYTVNIPSTSAAGYANADVAYQSTKKQLNNAIASGVFNTYVTHYAGVYNAPSMTAVTSSSAHYSTYVVVDDSSSSSSSKGLSVGAIVGIVIGGSTVLCILVGLGIWFCFFGGRESMCGARTPTTTTPALATLEEGIAVSAPPVSTTDVAVELGQVPHAIPVSATEEELKARMRDIPL